MGVFDDDHDTCEDCQRCGHQVQQAGCDYCDDCLDYFDSRDRDSRNREPARDDEGRTAQERYDDEWGDPLDTSLRY